MIAVVSNHTINKQNFFKIILFLYFNIFRVNVAGEHHTRKFFCYVTNVILIKFKILNYNFFSFLTCLNVGLWPSFSLFHFFFYLDTSLVNAFRFLHSTFDRKCSPNQRTRSNVRRWLRNCQAGHVKIRRFQRKTSIWISVFRNPCRFSYPVGAETVGIRIPGRFRVSICVFDTWHACART